MNIRYLKRESMWKASEGLARSASGSEATRFHNRGPSEHAVIYAPNRRQTLAENQEILRLDKSMIIPSISMEIIMLVLTGSV